MKRNLAQPTTKLTPRNYLERIPIAGLYNFLYAGGRKEKIFWGLLLLFSITITLMYLGRNVFLFAKYQTVIEVKHPSKPSLQLPRMHICLMAGLNITYFMEQIRTYCVPSLLADPKVMHQIKSHKISLWQFVWEMMLYMTADPTQDISFLNRKLVPLYNEAIYKMILAYGDKWEGGGSVYTKGVYRCNKIFDQCKLNGIEFPCCSNGRGTPYLASNTPCYKFNIKDILSNITAGSSSTKATQLTFRTKIDTKYSTEAFLQSDWFGIGVVWGNHLITLFDIADEFPAGTTAFVTLKSKRRQLRDGCTKWYQFNKNNHQGIHPELEEYFEGMMNPDKYSVAKCAFAQLLEIVSTKCGCVVYYDTIHPNDSSICTPAHLYSCFYGAVQSNVKIPDSNVGKQGSRGGGKDMFAYLKDRAKECLPLCDAWDYTAQYTFAELGGERGNSSKIISNQIIITIDPDYRLEIDVLKFDLISFFASIGDALSLFLGISLLAIVQAAVWAVAAAILQRKQRRVTPSTPTVNT